MSFRKVLESSNSSGEEHWISISDIMTVLMVIFLFISIIRVHSQIALTGENNQTIAVVDNIEILIKEKDGEIYEKLNALNNELKSNFPMWKAEIIEETLTIRFNQDVLFETGESYLLPEFEDALEWFCPRYIKVLNGFKDDISEIRIEGHTSSEWAGVSDKETAYFRNMKLSQDRTRSVLEFCMDWVADGQEKQWALEKMTANGLSSSHLILGDNKEEDREKSRRVEFRVVTIKDVRERNLLDVLKERQNK